MLFILFLPPILGKPRPLHQAYLRAGVGAVFRPPPRPPQEQLHAQAGLQDHAGDLAREANEAHRGQIGYSGNHSRLL